MSTLRRLRKRTASEDDVAFDGEPSSIEVLFAELERWRDRTDMCAVFDPESFQLLVMTRAHFAAHCEAADREALRRAPTAGFAVVLMSGTRVAPRALSVDELKGALRELEELDV